MAIQHRKRFFDRYPVARDFLFGLGAGVAIAIMIGILAATSIITLPASGITGLIFAAIIFGPSLLTSIFGAIKRKFFSSPEPTEISLNEKLDKVEPPSPTVILTNNAEVHDVLLSIDDKRQVAKQLIVEEEPALKTQPLVVETPKPVEPKSMQEQIKEANAKREAKAREIVNEIFAIFAKAENAEGKKLLKIVAYDDWKNPNWFYMQYSQPDYSPMTLINTRYKEYFSDAEREFIGEKFSAFKKLINAKGTLDDIPDETHVETSTASLGAKL